MASQQNIASVSSSESAVARETQRRLHVYQSVIPRARGRAQQPQAALNQSSAQSNAVALDVHDFLECSIGKEGYYYQSVNGKDESHVYEAIKDAP